MAKTGPLDGENDCIRSVSLKRVHTYMRRVGMRKCGNQVNHPVKDDSIDWPSLDRCKCDPRLDRRD